VRLATEHGGKQLEEPRFEIVEGNAIDFDPNQGTVARGDAVSPWDGLVIDGDYIKAEAQADRMGSMLYAVAIRTSKGRGFRPPTQTDLEALAAAEAELTRLLPQWEADDVLPTESVPLGNDTRPHQYGMSRWRDMFSPRQLLVHGTFLDEFRRLVPEVRAEFGEERGDAVLTQLALSQGKALNWNAALSSWNINAESTRSVFDRHDFAFKWTYAEFEGARELYPWCLEQILDAYEGLAGLLKPSDAASLSEVNSNVVPRPTVLTGNAADLAQVESSSVELVCIDPPYYDNVMYAELADFFYVWEKRTLGLIHPDLFEAELTDKQNEAVANPARFAEFGARRKELANADYQAKMAAIFAECARILRDDGVLTVMFTHKRAEAWDTLGMALMEAGLTIETSWPVNTESSTASTRRRRTLLPRRSCWSVANGRLRVRMTPARILRISREQSDRRRAKPWSGSRPRESKALTCCFLPTGRRSRLFPLPGRSTPQRPTSRAARGCSGRRRRSPPHGRRSYASSGDASWAPRQRWIRSLTSR